MLALLPLLACSPADDSGGPPVFAYTAPEDAPPLRGPGGPATSFTEEQLFQTCAFLDGGEADWDHHNLVVPYRGHLVLPWAAEWGTGGLTFWDVSDPCNPTKVGETWEQTIRETHAMGFVHLPVTDPHAGDWAVANDLQAFYGGLQFWDVSDATAPRHVVGLTLPGVIYPNSYDRISLSVFWQYPWVYVAAADNGVFVVDATDPANPILVNQVALEPSLRAGGVFALGNVLLVTSAEQSEAAFLDISDPANPQPIVGGRFATAREAGGEGVETYHGNLSGNLALFATKEGGGGLLVYDVTEPGAPTFVASYTEPDGNGGYVFYDEGFLFVGNSHFGAVYDARQLPTVTPVGRATLQGDQDTFTPYGNVAYLAVDDEAEKGQATAAVPWAREPDLTPPQVLRVDPPDGATGVPVTARVGVGFDEFVEPSTVFAGSIRLWHEDGTPVDGWGSGQEAIASFAPKAPLEPGVTYTVEVMAGGVADVNHNRLATTVTTTFTTAGP